MNSSSWRVPFAVATAVAIAAPAAAQVEEVVVTAQRREQRLQDTPIAVTAFSAQALADRGITNIKGITDYTPNVEMTVTSRPTAGGSAYAAFIRGVGNGDYAFPTDPAIGLYLDGVYLARTLGGLLDIADIARVEVLRGPQGTLYGRNTLGGAIQIVTTDPHLSGDLSGSVTLRAGEYGRFDALGDVNTPLVQGKVGAKLSVGSFNSDGWGRRRNGEHVNDQNRKVIRAGMLFALSDDLTLDVKADYSRQRQKGTIANYVGITGVPANVARFNQFAAPAQNVQYGLPAGSTFGPAFASSDPYRTNSLSPIGDDFDIGGVSMTANYTPSDAFKLKSITAWRGLSTHIQVDGDASPYTISSTDEKIHDHQISQELQLSGNVLGDRLKYLVGAYYFKEIGYDNKFSQSFHGVYQVTGVASDARDTLTYQRYASQSYAFFTQEEFTLLPGLTLVTGARINRDEKDFAVQVLLPERNNATSVPYQTRSSGWTSFTPKAGLNWKIADNALAYFSYAAGFKSGGFGSPTATAAAPVYNPEKLKTYEIGLKTQWFDRRLTANFAAFDSSWDDIQLSVIVPGPTGGVVNVTQNAGAAHLYGFEAELAAQPVQGLTFNLGLGYTHHNFTSLTPGATAAGLTLASKLPHVPQWSVSPGAEYSFATGFGQMTLRADASYRSDEFLTINDATSFQKGYWLLNARASFVPAGRDNLEFALEGSNLTDKVYLVYNQNATIFGEQLHVPGDPRLIRATVRYKF